MPFSYILSRAFLPMLATFAAAFALSPLAATFSEHAGALDVPDGGRHRHLRVTARGGGLAMFTASALGILLLNRFFADEKSVILLLCGAAAAMCGFLDDMYTLPAKGKLFLQILFCVPAPLYGVRIPYFPPFFATVATTAFLLLTVNAQNLVDGIDGLAGSLALVTLCGIFLFAVKNDVAWPAAVAVILFASVVGFLPYNAPRAFLFMGDCGSQFLGYAMGYLAMATVSESAVPASAGSAAGGSLFMLLLSCALLFFVPFCDVFLSIVRRITEHRSPFSADRGHLHYLLCDAGLSVPETVVLLLLPAICAVTSILLI